MISKYQITHSLTNCAHWNKRTHTLKLLSESESNTINFLLYIWQPKLCLKLRFYIRQCFTMLPLRPISQLQSAALYSFGLKIAAYTLYLVCRAKEALSKAYLYSTTIVAFSFIHNECTRSTSMSRAIMGQYYCYLAHKKYNIQNTHQIYMASPCSSFVRSSPSLVLILLMHSSGCKNLKRKRGRARRVYTKLPAWIDVLAHNISTL